MGIGFEKPSKNFIQLGKTLVCPEGYEWVPGLSGERQGISDMFLKPRSGRLAPRAIPNDLYIDLYQTELSPPGLSAIANRYGELGVARRHYHSETEESRSGRAETLSDWLSRLSSLKLCWRMWEATQSRNKRQLKQIFDDIGIEVFGPAELMLKAHSTEKDVPIFAYAKAFIVERITSNLIPGLEHHGQRHCFRSGCNWKPLTSQEYSITGHVRYEPFYKAGKLSFHLLATNLMTTAWLQFGEMIGGDRIAKRCEVCGEWMDLSCAERPRAKRMHERCSQTKRTRNWRQRSNKS